VAHRLKKCGAGDFGIECYGKTLVDALSALLQKFIQLKGIGCVHRLGLFFDFVEI
ncbi:MAG: hypothetical protein ACI80L_001215, partial [Pseudohongiellaceae bacterium]